MPVVEFALDREAQQRIQVHLTGQQTDSVTVMLNRSVLGTLMPGEHPYGQDFRLPDDSFVNVRIANGHLQVTHAGYPLPPVKAISAYAIDSSSPAALAFERRKKLGGCLIGWLVVNLLAIGIQTVVYFSEIFDPMPVGTSPTLFLLLGLLGIMGIVGLVSIFFWRR